MFVKHLLVSALISLILTGIFVLVFRRRGPWNSFLIFFVVVFLGAWAGGIWYPARGPAIGGVTWLPFFIVGLVLSLLLVAVIPPPEETTVELLKEGEKDTEARKKLVLGIYFWLMVLALAVMIVARYV